MAEIVYKKVSELDSASQPLAGTEVTMVSQLGASKKVALTNLYGSGWFAKLIAAFSAFKSPDSDHADNADTLGAGEEEPSDFHDATKLTGNIHLDRIPDDLTSKTATADGGNSDTVGGYSVGVSENKIVLHHGLIHMSTTTTGAIYDILDDVIPSTGDNIPLSGGVYTSSFFESWVYAYRSSSTQIIIYALSSTSGLRAFTLTTSSSSSVSACIGY